MTDTLVTGDPLVHDPEAKRKVVNRLKRAQGQLAAVITAVEDDAHSSSPPSRRPSTGPESS